MIDKLGIVLLAAGLSAAWGCESADGAGSHADADTDGDTDADGDTDVDSDADSDSDQECTDGAAICADDYTAQTCIGGEWVVTDECNPETQMCVGGVCADCVDIEFSIQTQQACAISILDGYEMDGEGFIELYGEQYRVFAMDRWGEGHIIAWADSTTTGELLEAFNVTGYLGQVDDPTVVSFGDNYLCNPDGLDGYMPDYVQYLGEDLPAAYLQNAEQMANDFDVLIFCGFRIPWSNDWIDEIAEFVSQHGKGFLAVMDYEGVVVAEDFTNMSAITSQAGIVFDPLNLDWAPTSVSVQLECVPDVPPVE